MQGNLSLTKSALLLFAIFTALTLSNCDLGTPDDQGRTNPLDSLNPDTHGDPYRLSAALVGGGVLLDWQPVTFPGLVGYSIYRKTDDSTYHRLIQVPTTSNTYTDHTIQNGHRYEYYVVVRTQRGDADATSVSKPSVFTPPALVIGNDTLTETPSRNVTLIIRSYHAKRMMISNRSDLTDAMWEPFTARKTWQLTVGPGVKTVYARIVQFSGDTSRVVFGEISPAHIHPTVAIAGSAPSTPTRRVRLTISAVGGTGMQLSNSPLTGSEPWIPFSTSHDWALATSPGMKNVYLAVRNDFNLLEVTHDQINPSKINPTIAIAGGAASTPTRRVRLTISAIGATGMQLSNSPLTGSEPWIPFSTSHDWALATGPGMKNVYLAVRNDFNLLEVTHDQINPTRLSPSITIADGAAATSTRYVRLTISASSATEMQLSNSPLTGSEPWIPFSNSIDWALAMGPGMKNVYLAVRNDFNLLEVAYDQINPRRMSPSIVIADGAPSTPTRQVQLTISATDALEMALSNSPFTGNETWIPYATTLDWELSAGGGMKNVYLGVRNDFYAIETTYDQINSPLLSPRISIVPDSLYINHNDVRLSMPDVGASEMKLAETPDSSATAWQPYQPLLNWRFADGDGWKRIYAWFKNAFWTSEPIVDSIGVDTRAEIASFAWSTTGGDTLIPGDQVTFIINAADDAFGVETDGTASVEVDGWQPILLADQVGGVYTGSYTIANLTPDVVNSRVMASFNDRLGNRALSLEADRRLNKKTPTPGEERDFPLGNIVIRMCWIPSGSFMMGRQPGEHDSDSDEDPRHQVTFAQGFWMGKYEVTQEQWETVMGNNPASGYGVGSNYPVYPVSWNEIQDFESALHDSFRLASESEWEYACRAGSTTRYYWGDDEEYNQIGTYAWYFGNSDSSTHPVGTKPANAWGLCDMSGNTWEWCEDWYHNNYNGAPDDGSAWVTGEGTYRVLRGGSWDDVNWGCRSSVRIGYAPAENELDFGFRVVASFPKPR